MTLKNEETSTSTVAYTPISDQLGENKYSIDRDTIIKLYHYSHESWVMSCCTLCMPHVSCDPEFDR